MMKKVSYLVLMLALLAAAAFSAVILQEDFTPAQNGTLPATLDADWDAGTDVKVTDLTTLGVPSDHTGGDGYALLLADLGAGYWNFAFPSNYASMSYDNNAVEAWVYFDFEGIGDDRYYGLYIRAAADPSPEAGAKVIYGNRTGYWLFVTANGAGAFGSYTPTDYRPFLLKGVDVYTDGWATPLPLDEGTGSYTTGWHKLRLVAIESTIQGYIDDVLEVEATDTTLASGFVGMVYYNHVNNGADEAGAFDNFLWETAATPTPTPSPTPAGVEQGWSLYE